MTRGGTSAGPSGTGITGSGLLRVVLLLVLLTVFAVASLYAFRAQGPSGTSVAFMQVLTELQAGEVRSVIIEGERATITLGDGRIQQTTTPGGDQLAHAVLDHNRADPARPVALREEPPAANFGLVMAIGMGLLPLVTLIALIVLAAAFLRRSTAPQRYASLGRLADLRDRGVITEDEFQREKRRLLR